MNRRKGSWTLVTVIFIPLLLSIIIFFSVYNGNKNVMMRRTQNALDSGVIYLANKGDVSEVINEDGKVTFCTLDHQKLEQAYQDFVKKGLIETIDGYNDYWSIMTYDEEGNELGFVTFAEIKQNIDGEYNELRYYYFNGNSNENVGIKIRVVIPFRRIENYKEYYNKYGVDLSEDDINAICNWNGRGLFSSPVSGWIVFDIESSSSCY